MPSIQQGRITPGTGQITFSSGSTSTTTTTVSTTASSVASSSPVTFSVQNASSSGIGLYDGVSQTGNDIVLTLSSLLGDNGIVISETDGLITVGINNSSVAFTGGTINGVIIGGTTPAAGTFTNAQFSAITAYATPGGHGSPPPFPITGLAGVPGGNGGSVTLTAGAGGATSGGNGGTLTISAGSALSGTSHGGGLTLNGGSANGASGAAGAVTINGGNATGGGGGAIFLFSGNAGSTGVGGVIGLTVGASGSGVGGSILLEAGTAAGTAQAGGNINLTPGLPSTTGTPGQVQINGNGGITNATYFFTGTPAATNQVFYIATRPMLVVAIAEIHAVASGSTEYLTVTHDTGTNAPGAGSSLMSGSFNLNATANTVQNATLGTVAATTLAAGDRVAVNFANGIQSSAGIVVSVSMAPQ